MISLCAVAVSTPQGRGCIRASSSSHDRLACSASRPSSTAAKATSAPASGCPLRRTLTVVLTVSRTPYWLCRRRHLHLQPVRGQPDLELRDAELEAGLGKVDQRRGRAPLLVLVAEGAPPLARFTPAPGEEAPPGRFAQPPAQHQHAHHHVGRPALRGGDRQLDHRLAPAERHHTRVDHAFAFHRHQRGGLREGHAHLQPRGLAGFELTLFGQQVDAVVVVLRKPPALAAADPGRGLRLAAAAGVVAGARDQLHLAGDLERGVKRSRNPAGPARRSCRCTACRARAFPGGCRRL